MILLSLADEIPNSSSDEGGSSMMDEFQIDEKLEEKLKKHGLNRRNAKTIIHVSK